MESKNYKISFCIVSMNRLHHLKQTLLQNINENDNYEELEFVVLDYNSHDGLSDWIKDNMSLYIENGRLIYYKTIEPQSWNPSHSKNLVFKLATGDIVCNIWADYYCGAGFASYVNQSYLKDNNIVITPIDFYRTKKNYCPPKDVLGKVCTRKEDFVNIRGFDERMNKHGFEDYDFVNRLELMGVKRVLIEDSSYLKYIGHGDEERYLIPTEKLHGIYVNYIGPSSSEVFIFYKNGEYEKGVITDNSTLNAGDYKFAFTPRNYQFEYSLNGGEWERGRWNKIENNFIQVTPKSKNGFVLKARRESNRNLLTNTVNGKVFYEILDPILMKGFWDFHHFHDTRSIMEKNIANGISVVNPLHYGKGAVYKNFEFDKPIFV